MVDRNPKLLAKHVNKGRGGMLDYLDYVEVVEEDRPDNNGRSMVVRAFARGVDRPEFYGIHLGTKMALVNRAVACMLSGRYWTDPQVRTDVGGQTYLSTTSQVMGRYVNSDLKKLGF